MILIILRKYSYAIFGLFFSLNTFSQELTLLNDLKTEEDYLLKTLKEISYPTIRIKDHFHYLEKSWQNSMIVTTDGQKLFFNGRYNLLNRSIEYKINSTIRTIHINQIQLAKIGETTLIPLTKIINPDVKRYQYLEVLSFGQLNLLKGYKLGGMGGSDVQSVIPGEAEYHIYENLFFTHNFKEIYSLTKSKKKILNLFKSEQENLKEYARQEKLKFGDGEDLIKIFDYYNSLLN